VSLHAQCFLCNSILYSLNTTPLSTADCVSAGACAIFRAIKIDVDAEELIWLVAVNAMCSVPSSVLVISERQKKDRRPHLRKQHTVGKMNTTSYFLQSI
jgi:hypothetical protein